MVIKQNQFKYNSSIIQVNSTKREELEHFIEEYLNHHSYFKSKDIALEYLFEKYQFTFYDLSKELAIIQNLTRKIGKLIAPYKLSGTIIPYNAKIYQVINRK